MIRTRGKGQGLQVSEAGGRAPVWSREGRELFYLSGDRLMGVAVQTQPAFRAGLPRVLFEGPVETRTAPARNFDVSPDGGSFVMVARGRTEAGPRQVSVVLGWFQELNGLAPAGTR